jgi:hypothetical protein
MGLGKPGDVVSFLHNGTTTTYGIVVGDPDTVSNDVAYDFGVPNASQIYWAKRENTTAVTVLGAGQD